MMGLDWWDLVYQVKLPTTTRCSSSIFSLNLCSFLEFLRRNVNLNTRQLKSPPPAFNKRTQKNWSWTFWLHSYFACVLDRVDFRATKSMAYQYEVIAWSMTWCQWSMTWCPFGFPFFAFIDIVAIDVILKLIKVAKFASYKSMGQATQELDKRFKPVLVGYICECWLSTCIILMLSTIHIWIFVISHIWKYK